MLWAAGDACGAPLKHEWNDAINTTIMATLEDPHELLHQGTARVYLTDWFRYCDPIYRSKVVVATQSILGGGMKGVITAFKEFW